VTDRMDEAGALRRHGWRIAMWGVLAGLLALPAVAMAFTDEVRWDAADFLVMGVMLGSVGVGGELAMRMSRNLAYRLGFALALVAGFLLLWINLAVGIIGGEDNPANAMYGAVLLIAFCGAFVSMFRAGGLGWTMVAAAVAQCAVPFVAEARGFAGGPQVLFLTVFFAGLWLTSSVLFRVAAREDREAAPSAG
jgi:hypothetical protein